MSGPFALVVVVAIIWLLSRYRVQIAALWRAVRPQPQGGGQPQPGQPQAAAQPQHGRPHWGWGIGLAIVAIIVAVLAQKNQATVAALGREYWMFFLVLFVLAGIAAFLVATPEKRKQIWLVLVILAVLLFVVVPAAKWSFDRLRADATPTNPEKTAAARKCPEISTDLRSCAITKEWTHWIRIEDGARAPGKKVCHSYGVDSGRDDQGGATRYRFRTVGSSDGGDTVKYRLVSLDTDCRLIGF